MQVTQEAVHGAAFDDAHGGGGQGCDDDLHSSMKPDAKSSRNENANAHEPTPSATHLPSLMIQLGPTALVSPPLPFSASSLPLSSESAAQTPLVLWENLSLVGSISNLSLYVDGRISAP